MKGRAFPVFFISLTGNTAHKKTGLLPGFFIIARLMCRFSFVLLRTLEAVSQLIFLFIQRHGYLTPINQ